MATINVADKTTLDSVKSLLQNSTYGLSAIKTAASASVIKSVQRKWVSVSNSTQSITSTISSVNTSKTVIISSSASGSNGDIGARVELTDSTTVTILKFSSSTKVAVAFEVLEFV